MNKAKKRAFCLECRRGPAPLPALIEDLATLSAVSSPQTSDLLKRRLQVRVGTLKCVGRDLEDAIELALSMADDLDPEDQARARILYRELGAIRGELRGIVGDFDQEWDPDAKKPPAFDDEAA